ncbi:MAG: glutaredoxin family protein [Terriglobales bacterium]
MLTTSRPLTLEKMPRGDARGRSGWATVPGLLVSVLPFGGCPACWPLYAGALSALGLGALLSEAYLLPVTSVLLTFSVGALAWQAKRRRGYQPFVLGLLAATGILLGKFVVHSGLLAGSGVAVLVAASLWNVWPLRTANSCPQCAPAGSPRPGASFQSDPSGETMTSTSPRTVEIYSAGCPACQAAIDLVNQIACPSCRVTVHDMNQPGVAEQARRHGVATVPAVVIDGKLAGCCSHGGPDEATLRRAGLGVAR